MVIEISYWRYYRYVDNSKVRERMSMLMWSHLLVNMGTRQGDNFILIAHKR